MGVPVQLPLYHSQVAPVPNEPPLLERIVLWPRQIVVDVAVADVAGTDVSRTVSVKLRQTVVLQVPSALT